MLYLYNCIYLFLAVQGRHCRKRAFSSCSEQGLLLCWAGASHSVASLDGDTGSRACGLRWSQRVGSIVAVSGLQSSDSEARGVLPDQGSSSCLFHWQENSLSLNHLTGCLSTVCFHM